MSDGLRTDVNLVFLACAIGTRYEKFLPPFIFFALKHNPNSWVEVVVPHKKAFERKYSKVLNQLKLEGFNAFSVRNFQSPRPFMGPNATHKPNTYRFFEVPEKRGKFTYIGDVDIMSMTDVVTAYSDPWPSKNLPYNNFIRPKSKRLRGLHFVKTDAYYTTALMKAQVRLLHKAHKQNDEHILYRLCKNVHKLPPTDWAPSRMTSTPSLGIHFSPNRGPGKRMKLRTPLANRERFIKLKEEYPELFRTGPFRSLASSLTHNFREPRKLQK